jgi:hypothetical protein
MCSLDTLLAMALLTGVSDVPDPAQASALYSRVHRPMQALAVRWEILDSREARYILARQEDFLSDLNLLRRRYRDLIDAPAILDCQRFPERSTVNELLAFNRSYRQYIDIRQPVELIHWWELRTTLHETDRLYQVWDAVRDARCDYYYVTVRRQALKRLRELIGDEAYHAANLPPCVPLWRFQPIR